MELFNGNAKKVRLVDSETGKATEVNTSEAIRLADEAQMDLVCISDKGDMPVVKICDYKKLLFDTKKKEKAKRQNSTKVETKEIRLTGSIAEHDMETKAKSIDKFLKHGDKVILSIRYKGRTIKMIGNGADKLQSLLDKVSEKYQVVNKPVIDKNKVYMTIAPSSK